MESEGVLEIYNRSLEKYNVRYNPFIGDGDSSSYSAVDRERPYGASVFVEKRECVNHVTKRMGSSLRSLVRDYKGKKLSDGKCLSGRGRLTTIRIDAIQNFYGRSIRDNKGNTEKMSKEIWAILGHYSSTENVPKHDKCPIGKSSWCSFQRDKATGMSTYKPPKNPLSEAIIDVIKPIFNRLASVAFLENCKTCSNQNANESFNSVVWGLSPKESFNSPTETSLAVNLAVCLFNDGFEATLISLLKYANFQVMENSIRQWHNIDKERMDYADYVASAESKARRKHRKSAEIKKQDAFQHQEGTQYKSGAFYNN